jgi:CheY-like chemotaxis protein
MNILLLDDDVRDVPETADVWRLLGHSVTQVTDWRDLEEALKKNRFDAALIDLMIPAIGLPVDECSSGFTTGEYIHRTYIQPKMPTMPFAVFSAAVLGLEVIAAANKRLSTYSNYRGYFVKGVDNQLLLETISK